MRKISTLREKEFNDIIRREFIIIISLYEFFNKVKKNPDF